MNIYITDALKCITENTAIAEGSNCMSMRWVEMNNNNVINHDNEISGDEMVDNFLERIGV